MATVGLKIALILLAMTVCCIDAKRKHVRKQTNGSVKTTQESLTSIFMGDGSRDNGTRDNKSRGNQLHASRENSQHSVSSTNKSRNGQLDMSRDVTSGVDKSHNKSKSADEKKDIGQGSTDKGQRNQSSLSTPPKKEMQRHRDTLHSKPKGSRTSSHAVTRENIADDISKIDDVQNLYHQGLNNDDNTMDKVNQIDAGELTDYFHALNGENDKTVSGHHHHDQQQSEENQSLKSDKEDTDEGPGNQKNTDSKSGPGYEEFSDNPDEMDADDFYDSIAKGKKPEVKMRKLRPTKSHFGNGERRRPTERQDNQPTNDGNSPQEGDHYNDNQSQQEGHYHDNQNEQEGHYHDNQSQQEDGGAKVSDESKPNNEPDPDVMGYPYPLDNEHGPTEETTQHEDSKQYAHGPKEVTAETEDTKQYTNHPTEETAEHEDSKQYAHGPTEETTQHGDSKQYAHGHKEVTAETENTKQYTNHPTEETAEHEDSKQYAHGPTETTTEHEDREQNSSSVSSNSAGSTSGSKEYADTKEGHGQATSDGYNPFLNPMFNPFSIFGLNKKQSYSKQDNSPSTLSTSKVGKTQSNVKVKPDKQSNKLTSKLKIKGTRIQGGKITGGTITGGVIEGGEITAGSIEGGIIKGGRMEGGKFKNGTMEGGVFHDGLFEGGHLINGSFEGGRMKGGYMYGGQVKGGSIYGGTIKGGVLLGGLFHGGSLEGGIMKGGEIHRGSIKGGKMEGGIMTGGSMEGGLFKFGKLSGGTIKSGSMLGGEMTNGSIEGGTLKGGSISGGVLKGGVMEGGQLKGGVVLAGKIKGGIIEGGVIEGGEINDGVIIKGGRINGTILAVKVKEKEVDKSDENTSKEKNEKQDEKEKEEHKTSDGLNSPIKHIPGVIMKEPKHVEISSQSPTENDTQQPKIIEDINNMNTASSTSTTPINNMNTASTNTPIYVDPRVPIPIPYSKDQPQLTNPPTGQPYSQKTGQGTSTNTHIYVDPGVPPPYSNDQPQLTNPPTGQPYSQTTGQGRDLTPSKRGKHHVVFDGISFDIPEEGFSTFIRRIKSNDLLNELVNHADSKMHEVMHDDNPDAKQLTNKSNHKEKAEEKAEGKNATDEHHGEASGIKPEDIEVKLSPSKPADVHNNTTDQHPMMSSWAAKPLTFKPSYHWSLSNIIGDRVPGSPGAAMISHGHILKTRGGLAFNGKDAWLGGGDYAGGCISAPDKCDDGFSFEMTLKIDKDSLLHSNDMRYIVDSGASTFNSKGFSLYTLHGKLRADLAIPGDSICLETPLEPDRWHDVLVTWRKEKGLKMFLNCDLKGEVNNGEQCLGCRSPGCHMTDVNTQLMIGRPNYSPHFHCTKFESGDISFWEKYLDDDDINTLCGRNAGLNDESTSAPQPTITTPNNSPTQVQQPYTNYQANDQQTYQQNNPMTSYPAPYQAPYPSPYSSPPARYLTPGKTYHFTEYMPAMSPSPPYTGNQMYSGYYPASAPAPSTTNTAANLFSSQPSYVPGATSLTQTRASLASSPVISQYFTPWSSWSACSETCGYGVRARSRTCKNPQILLGGHVCSGPSVQHGFCFMKACPGTSHTTARKSLVKKILRDLVKDFTLRESKKIPIKLPHFTIEPQKPRAYSTKSHFISRKQTVQLNGKRQPLHLVREKPVDEHAFNRNMHTVDGHYGNWSPWGQCDRSCGRGAQVRTRLCHNPPPSIMGRSCITFGPSVQVRRCNVILCPVNGGYSTWSKFSDCSKTCGPGGVRFRIRTCSNPPPSVRGKPCVGPGQETRPCLNYNPCQVHPRYSVWSQWSGCDADCGGGVRERMRQCIISPPGSSGESCSSLGPNRMTELCNLAPCDG